MTPITFLLVLIGVSYTSYQVTRFIVWLDGADEPDGVSELNEPSIEPDIPDERHLDAA